MRRVALRAATLGILASCAAEQRDDDASWETEGGLDSKTSFGASSPGGDHGDIKLDVGMSGPVPGGCPDGGGGGGFGQVAFSNLWIANSLTDNPMPDGTVSKIDTKTGEHQGRYRTGPMATSDPSRTSVNLLGDAAVVNRGDGGSVVKIAAEESRCEDKNGDGTIQTSRSADEILPWGEDECVLWSAPLFPGARAVAWDSGNDPESGNCEGGPPSLWVTGLDATTDMAHIRRLNGETGETEGEATVPGWLAGGGQTQWGGPYGGAVDDQRNFWFIGKEHQVLYRVDYTTFEVSSWPAPAEVGTSDRFYAIALDKDGNPYVTVERGGGMLLKFHAGEERWEVLLDPIHPGGNGNGRGVAVDDDGDAWIAVSGHSCMEGSLAHYDYETGAVSWVVLPNCNIAVGVCIDLDGYPWVVDTYASDTGFPLGRVFKVDKESHAVMLSVGQLSWPYTYSDFCGGGLRLVTFPPTL